jgi:hypothetical protein
MGRGLYANIHENQMAGKKPRKKGQKGAPTDADFARAAKTAKNKPKAKPKTRRA